MAKHRKPRNYRKEYQRRIALARKRSKALGRSISRAQVRGHARTAKGELSIALLKRNRLIEPEREGTLKRYFRAIRNFLKGESVRTAAKKAGMSPTTLKHIGKSRGVLSVKPGKRGYEITPRSFNVVTSEGKSFEAVAFDRATASVMGAYWNAVQQALTQGTGASLKPFKNKTVTDLGGQKYRLMTNINALQTIMGEMTQEEQEDFYKNLYRKYRHAA